MRGKRFFHVERRRKDGITPADAGKTSLLLFTFSPKKDHPRGCGENLKRKSELNTMIGSPPRMRGKLVGYCILTAFSRITPADAGKTDLRFANLEGAEDHPRGCGENLLTLFQTNVYTGSPPRMRGKPCDDGR